MNFDDFDREMRSFELSLDERWPEEGYIVARLDGRGFTKLTKEQLDFERPFDLRFHHAMQKTTEHLMTSGFRTVLAYTHSDEISLLFHRDMQAFSRRTRKLNTVLAGEASGVFSLEVATPVAFDCRLCPLPSKQRVIDYVRWRAEDAKRNGLSAYCYWTLRSTGLAPNKASASTDGMSWQDKIALLQAHGITFEEQPAWQRLGALLSWESETKPGRNPITGDTIETDRLRLRWLNDIPVGDALSEWIARKVIK